MNLYVGNLPYDVTDDALRAAFETYGEVSSVNVIMDRETGRSKGFAFVEISDNSVADAAIKGLNGSTMSSREIKVNEAKPRNDRGGGGARARRW
jgi:RNA recognition motif-containing protein